MTSAFWWQGDSRTGHVTNLGDQLTRILLEQFAGIDVEWAPIIEADIICCGSLLDSLPRSGWHGTVIGAGQLHRGTVTDLTFANVMGLRGTLTRERVQCGNQTPVIGDPALLAPELVTPTPNSIELGIIPHWSDPDLWPRERDNALKYGYAKPTLIDITGPALRAIELIGSCRKIVTSALHGAIIADAFHIPRRVEPFPAMMTDTVHEGGAFKFRDHGTALGQKLEFGVLQTAPKLRVDQIQYDLFNAFRSLGEQYA